MRVVKSFMFLSIFVSAAYADTWVITSLNDSGSGTLREALTNAVDGDFIEFDSPLSGTLTLASSLPDIAANYLTLTGPEDMSISIDGDSLYRIFGVEASALTLSNLNLLNGSDASQGGILHLGSAHEASLTNVALTSASGTNGENSLFVESDGMLTLTDVTYSSATDSQIYLNAGTLRIMSNIPLQFSVDGVGGGSIWKFGNSSATITTPPSVTSDYSLIAASGLLSFTGSLAGGCLVIIPGALEGNFSALEASSFLATVQPGDASNFGQMTLAGNYNSYLGTTAAKIDPSGNVDLIHAGADVSLVDASLTILPQSGTYTMGDKYTFLSTDGGITGAFVSVDLGGLDARINYHSNFIEVEILSSQTL